jgi:hypothetical protein
MYRVSPAVAAMDLDGCVRRAAVLGRYIRDCVLIVICGWQAGGRARQLADCLHEERARHSTADDAGETVGARTIALFHFSVCGEIDYIFFAYCKGVVFWQRNEDSICRPMPCF